MKHDIDEMIYMGRLLDFYGSLLSKTQYAILDSYYRANLSLSELSDLYNVSRSAVSDALKKGTLKLRYYEEKLKICKVFDDFYKENNSNKEVVKLVEERIKNGI